MPGGGWETAGVVFVVNAFGAWLVEQLADAGRKKLTELILGDEHDRALRQAADAAIRATAAEVSPLHSRRAEQAVMVIGQVFSEPALDAPRAGPVMLLEGLRAGIARQLAVLDDVSLTGTGRSSADALGVPGAVLADRLTGHLVREIMVRGSRGSPLTALADQLNHELTRLQGQRFEGELARLTAEIRDARALPGGSITPAGRLLEEVTDPFAVEVHRPVQLEDPQPGLRELPAYVPREHDASLEQVVRAAAGGRSGIAVLVGGSSTGKTRACWEALQILRAQPGRWRLWHPIDPTRPDAALQELPRIGPRTVVWLNEAEFYLDPADGVLGERVAAGLRELLRDPARAPVLVLATLWPRYWGTLTARPDSGADPHAQARELLAGHDITVPSAFTPAQLGELGKTGDARLALAATAARDGQVIQFLAGAPELLARYRNAPPVAAALIGAALDARRLGMGAGLPRAFLEAAVPGYLTEAEWDALGEDWLQQAMAYAAVPCKGVPGPLTCIRPRPPRSRPPRPASRDGGEQPLAGPTGPTGGPVYRLADYLDQHGRQHRKSQIPPAEFWAAAADHVGPVDQAVLGDAADARGLYREAAQLHKNAAAAGNLRAASYLSGRLPWLRDDARPVRWAVAHAALDDPDTVAELLRKLRERGAQDQATALASRAAAHVPLDDPGAVAALLESLRAPATQDQATALLDRDPAARVSLDDPYGVARLLENLREAGAQDQATALLDRDPAARVSLDGPGDVAKLLENLREAGAQDQVTALASRAADHVPLDDPIGVSALLGELREAGAQDQVAALASRAADHVPLDDPIGVADLLRRLWGVGAEKQATALADRAVTHVSIDDALAMSYLLDHLTGVGAEKQATALADRAIAHFSLDDTIGLTRLLPSLQEAGAYGQATALADRAIPYLSLDDPGAVAALLQSLRAAHARDQIIALLDRDPAARVSLDDPRAAAWLLESLLEVGAGKQATVLADRAAAHAPLDDPHVVILLGVLWRAGAKKQVTTLMRRDPAAHVPLDDPGAVAALLKIFLEAAAHDQIATLLDRDPAARVSLDDPPFRTLPPPLKSLLEGLQEAGAREQATALAERLPAAGLFDLFCQQQDRRDRFQFGRETDGRPAEPWDWDDLD